MANSVVWMNECSDARFHLSKFEAALAEGKKCIIYTKTLTKGIVRVLCNNTASTHLHLTISGWGSTWLEPGVETAEKEIEALHRLLQIYPANRVTVRVDPVIPTIEGMAKAVQVLSAVPQEIRVISSIIQLYSNMHQLFDRLGVNKAYYTVKSGNVLFPSQNYAQAVYNELNHYHTISVCGHPYILEGCDHDGCVNTDSMRSLGLIPVNMAGKQRPGCKCQAVKRQLLKYSDTCSHGCLYCYAHRNA